MAKTWYSQGNNPLISLWHYDWDPHTRIPLCGVYTVHTLGQHSETANTGSGNIKASRATSGERKMNHLEVSDACNYGVCLTSGWWWRICHHIRPWLDTTNTAMTSLCHVTCVPHAGIPHIFTLRLLGPYIYDNNQVFYLENGHWSCYPANTRTQCCFNVGPAP